MMDGFSVSAYCATLSYDYNAIKSDGIISSVSVSNEQRIGSKPHG